MLIFWTHNFKSRWCFNHYVISVDTLKWFGKVISQSEQLHFHECPGPSMPFTSQIQIDWVSHGHPASLLSQSSHHCFRSRERLNVTIPAGPQKGLCTQQSAVPLFISNKLRDSRPREWEQAQMCLFFSQCQLESYHYASLMMETEGEQQVVLKYRIC